VKNVVITEANILNVALMIVTPGSVIGGYKHLRRTYFIHLRGIVITLIATYKIAQRQNSEGHDQRLH
jgi:hypothetical protein